MIDFDYILSKFNGLGRYQIALIIMVTYCSVPSGWNSIAPVFLNYTPDYRCNVPPIDYAYGLTEEEILNLTTPYNAETQKYDTCKMYYFNSTACNSFDENDLESCIDKTADPIPCNEGYYFDNSTFPRTVTTEFNLVCEKKSLDAIATVIYMIGVLLGSLIFGTLSDRYGRKIIMASSSLLSFAALIGSAFVHNYWLFVFSRFSIAFFGFGMFISNYVYLLEIVSNKWRTLIGVGFQLGFAIGYMILSGIAYQWRDWHEMELVMGLLSLPYGLFLIIIPESPRWLFSMNKDEKAKKITRTFAKYNGVNLKEPDIWEEAEMKMEKSSKDEDRTYSYSDLFRKRGIRRITFHIMYNWAVNSFVYYGISLNAGALAGDIFVNNAISITPNSFNTFNGAMEIGAYLFVILFMDRTGRKLMLTVMLALAGISLICSTIVTQYAGDDQGLITLGVVFAFAGKVGSSGAYAVVYNFTVELYPTVVRGNGMGIASTFARIGSILAPLILAIQSYIVWLPNVIFGVFALSAALQAFLLPETKSIDMMETLEEAEMFYLGKRNSVKGSSNEAFESPEISKL